MRAATLVLIYQERHQRAPPQLTAEDSIPEVPWPLWFQCPRTVELFRDALASLLIGHVCQLLRSLQSSLWVVKQSDQVFPSKSSLRAHSVGLLLLIVCLILKHDAFFEIRSHVAQVGLKLNMYLRKG